MDDYQVTDSAQEKVFIFSLVLCALIVTLNMTNINIALPSLMAYFNADMATLQWVVVGYMMASVLTMPMTGYLMDRFSCKSVILVGSFLMLISSVLCALATTAEFLIIARILLGLAGGISMPVTSTLVYQFLPRERQLVAVSYTAMISAFGVALGPSISGIIIGFFNWQAIFLVNIPLILLAIIMIIKVVPHKVFTTGEHLDVLGIILSSLSTVGILLGFNQGSTFGWTSPLTLTLIIGSSILMALFVLHELRSETPMLNFKVFAYKGFSYSFIVNSVLAIATILAPTFMSLYVQNSLGYSPTEAGLAMVIPSLFMAIMAPVATKTATKYTSRLVIVVSLIILTIATLGMCTYTITTGIVVFTVWLSLRYIGIGLSNPLINNFAMSSIPARLASHGSAMIAWTRQVVSTISLSLFTLIYNNHVINYTNEGLAAELGAVDQARYIVCQSSCDVNFYSVIIIIITIPLVFLMKDALMNEKDAQ